MKKKVWVLAMVLVLVAFCPAAITITTADGSGADGGVSNDSNQGPNVVMGASTTAPIRHFDGTRAKAAILRFDVRSVGGDMSGTTLEITTTSTNNRARTINIWALTDDSLDNWDEATLCYNTAPGLIHEGEDGYTLAILGIDETKWTVIGTIDFSATVGLNTASIDPDYLAEDKNGLITLLLYNTASDNSNSYYIAMKENGTGIPTLTFPNARCAIDPVPAVDAEVLPSLTTLSWTNTEPNNLSGIITCDVYLGTNEPNLAKPGYNLIQLATGTADTSVTIPEAMRPLAETTYYWIVDSYDSSTEPPFLKTGAVWTFNVTAIPLIKTHPVPLSVPLGQTAEFSVVVESFSPAEYTWYYSTDNANNTPDNDTQVGTNADTLSLVTVSADEGYYYCKVVNNSGEINAAYSNPARLVVQRAAAHWTLNAADFVEGQYIDSSSEGHHADPNGPTPAFVPGVITGSEGVSMDAYGFASAGTWNPSTVSDAFTVSMWIKWNGNNGAYQNLLSKMDSWAADDMMWQFGISAGNQIGIIRSGGATISNGSPVVGEWEFIALTFDGSTATVYRVLDGNIFFSTVAGAFSLGTDTEATLWLGASAGGGQLFNGTMDEVQIFNYAKDDDGIAELFNEMISREFCVLEYGSAEFALDVNNNCRIDLADFSALAAAWMGCGIYPETACP